MTTNFKSLITEIILAEEDLTSLFPAGLKTYEKVAQDILDIFALKPRDYPTVNGWYWFYGDPFAKGNGHKTETRIYSVKVIHVDGVPKYIADGDFFMNHKPGLWAEALVPEKQAISKLE